MQALFAKGFSPDTVPGKTVSLEKILHGEQYIEILGDIPQDGKLYSKSKVVEVLDKGSGAVIVNNSKSLIFWKYPMFLTSFSSYYSIIMWLFFYFSCKFLYSLSFLVETYDESGKLVLRNQCASFAVGAGNFGGPRTGTQLVPCQNRPDRQPDITVTEKTTIDQAALYRLSGNIYIYIVYFLVAIRFI